MSKLIVEFDEEELKVMIAEIIAGRLNGQLNQISKSEIKRLAKDIVLQRMADQIQKEILVV